MNIHIAHIINVTEINESKKASYLHVAQPVTMQSMVTAKRIVKDIVDVDLFAIKHKDEEIDIPHDFEWAPDIKEYAWEHIEGLQSVLPHKPLPRIVDILDGLRNASEAEYFIYTNVDIGLLPNFYLTVNQLIDAKLDAFCINRRTIPKEYNGITLDKDHIELAYLINGIPHPGIDCFVFKRDIVPLLQLSNVYIGYPPIGSVLKTQIEKYSRNFRWIKDLHLTFHLGNEVPWKKQKDVYWQENAFQAKGLYTLAKKRLWSIKFDLS